MTSRIPFIAGNWKMNLDHQQGIALVQKLACHIPEAGYLAWLDVTSWNLGDKTVAKLIQDAKVSLVAGNDHGPDYVNHVRLNFGTSPEIITEGLTRIAKALKS